MKTFQQILVSLLLALVAISSFAADVASGKGAINRIDSAAGTVNISHEPIPALKWPAMAMDFKVADKRLLSGLKPGQTIGFGLARDATHGYVISRVEAAVPAK